MKTFLKKIAPFVLFILLLEIAVPILVDPYNIFHWKRIRDNGVEPNSNYIKMQYILHNPDKFDSFLFGSSRTGFIDVEKIPEGKWYNMSYSEGLPKEHLENLREMIEHGIIPKNVMVGVDNISCFVDPSLHENQFYRIPYPREDKLGFYAKYLSIRGVIASLEVSLEHETEDPDYVDRYYRSGSSRRDPSLGERGRAIRRIGEITTSIILTMPWDIYARFQSSVRNMISTLFCSPIPSIPPPMPSQNILDTPLF